MHTLLIMYCLKQKWQNIMQKQLHSNIPIVSIFIYKNAFVFIIIPFAFRKIRINLKSAVIFLHLVASVTLIIQMYLPGINGCLIVTTSHCFVNKKSKFNLNYVNRQRLFQVLLFVYKDWWWN